MRKISAKQKVAVVIGGGAVAIAGAGSAFAYWTTTGNGSGSAATASANGTLVLSATVPAGLAPGQSGAVTFTAANSSASNLELTTLKIDSISVTPASGSCAASNFAVGTSLDAAGASQSITESEDILAGATAQAVTTGTTLYFLNTDANQDGCKGAQVTLNLSSV